MNLSSKQSADLVRGLASAATLCGLLIVVPILLILGVGWPLPLATPSGSDALTALKTGAMSPSLVLKPISLVVWVLWLQMTTGVGIELWAHLHGRVAPRVSIIPLFMQRMSARLLGTVLIVAISLQQHGTALADNKDLLSPPAVELDLGQSWSVAPGSQNSFPIPFTAADEITERESSDPEPFFHTVNRRDSLRTLAKQYLGDPDRWTEVFVLNQGQAQADGGSLTDPARLQPGWQLVMPADAHLPAPTSLRIDETPDSLRLPADSDKEFETPTVSVQKGDTLRALASHHLEDPERWVEIFDANQEIIQDPDVIQPGWQLQMPNHHVEPTVVELSLHPLPELADHAYLESDPNSDVYELAPLGVPPISVSNDSPVSVAAFSTSKPTAIANVPPLSKEQQSPPSRQTMLAVGGLGVFVSSLGWVLTRLRKIQRRRLPDGRIPLRLPENAADVEQELEAAADPESALFLDAALRVMSSRVAGAPPPNVIGATLNSDGVSIHLSSPADAPPGLHSNNDSTTWTLHRDGVLEDLLAEADAVPAPLPTLVALGTRDGNECLLNLEHVAALCLEGDAEAIAEMCAAIAAQLASSHLADDLTVICVGFGQELTVFERVEHVPDVASALERVKYHRRQNRALLGNHPCLVESRIGTNGDYWEPIVVLVPSRLSEEEATDVLNACGSAVCVVAHGLEGADWLGHFDEGGLLLQPLGLRLDGLRVSGAAVSALAQLVSAARDTEGVELPAPATPRNQEGPFLDAPSGPGIEVRVMGTVEIAGTAYPITSRRALDLVAFLAFHPEGADRDQLKAQVWPPDQPPSNSTVANTVSQARRALGLDDNNQPYLPRVSSKGIYRLRAEVGTDVDRFETLVSAAHNDPGDQGRMHLQAALELVRGIPFTGGCGDMYRWADFGLRTQVECLVDTAAHELASRCIDVGDFRGAGRAAMVSLRNVGFCEECYRWRLMGAAQNPIEVRKIMAELENLLKRENGQGDINDLISSELLDLYEQMMSTLSESEARRTTQS